MALQELDSSNGALLPFYDPDTSVVYVCGKVGLGRLVGQWGGVSDSADSTRCSKTGCARCRKPSGGLLGKLEGK